MNSFLDLHSDADYRNTNRPYYTGTWEYTNIAVDRFIPFQFTSSGSDAIVIETEDTDGAFTTVTSGFTYPSPTFPVTWAKTGSGTWSSSGAQITAGTVGASGYQTSSALTLTANQPYVHTIDQSAYSGIFSITLYKAAVVVWTKLVSADSGKTYFVPEETGTDYTFVIAVSSLGGSVTANTPTLFTTSIGHSGAYWWYTGAQLISTTLSGIFRLRITCGSDVFYSDWCDVCGFTDKTKITLSSSYDYGGIKYVDGYSQWMYKNATVRRSPKAEIEITGDKLNGAIIEEKKVAAIRYKITMKCTESEYEGLVHAMGGTLTITDQTGKSYTAVNIELTDPSWYKANGIVELSFVDSANINIYTRNNSDL